MKKALIAGKSLVSLDVFDTLLLRNVKPEIVRFWEIALAHANALRQEKESFTRRQLFVGRQLAMRIAYRTAEPREEERDATWKSIYAIMLDSIGAQIEGTLLDLLLRAEVQYETRNLFPNRHLVRFLRRTIEEYPTRVVLVSDMYLPASAIDELVRKICGPLKFSYERCYVSSEYGVTKHGGGLFRVVLENEGVGPHEVVHFGDNPVSDYRTPTRLGISAYLVPRTSLFYFIRRRLESAFSLCSAALVGW